MNPILVVDDNAQIVDILSQYIKKEGWPMLAAKTGEEALALFDAAEPSLILLDIMLPGLDGLEVCRRIRRVSSVPILMITAKDEGAECMLLTPNRMCAYVAPSVKDAALVRAAEDCSKVQNSGVLDAYVDAARALARERKIPVADAYAEWNRLEAAGVDTTALLANDINHPTEDMHGVFVEKIMDALLRGEG